MKKGFLTMVMALLCAVSCVFGLIACGGNNGTVGVESVTLNQNELALTVGDEETLTATVASDNATDKTVVWSVAPSGIVTVENGKVTAVAAGTATVTATAGDKSAICTVTVSAPAVSVSGTYYTYWGDFDDNIWTYGDGEAIVMHDDNTCVLDGEEATYAIENGIYVICYSGGDLFARIDGNIMYLYETREEAEDEGNLAPMGFAYRGEVISEEDRITIETAYGMEIEDPDADTSAA